MAVVTEVIPLDHRAPGEGQALRQFHRAAPHGRFDVGHIDMLCRGGAAEDGEGQGQQERVEAEGHATHRGPRPVGTG